MADPLRDPDANEPLSQARRTGWWFLRYRNAFRLALLLLIAGFFAWGLLGAGEGRLDGAAGFAIALAMAWAVMEILWFLIDRASPDRVAEPED